MQYRRPQFYSWVGRSPGEGIGYPLQYSWAILGGSGGKESTCNTGNLGSAPGLGRTPEEGNSYPLQYSGLENSMDCIVCGVTKVRHDRATFTFNTFSISGKGLIFKIYKELRTQWKKYK